MVFSILFKSVDYVKFMIKYNNFFIACLTTVIISAEATKIAPTRTTTTTEVMTAYQGVMAL